MSSWHQNLNSFTQLQDRKNECINAGLTWFSLVILLTANSQSAIPNVAEKAANFVAGFSTLTRKFSAGTQGGSHHGNQYGRRSATGTGSHRNQHGRSNQPGRPKSLSVVDQRMSKSTSEPMNLLTDELESPGVFRMMSNKIDGSFLCAGLLISHV